MNHQARDQSTFLLALVANVSLCSVLLVALLIKLFDAVWNQVERDLAQSLFGLRSTLPLVVLIVAIDVAQPVEGAILGESLLATLASGGLPHVHIPCS